MTSFELWEKIFPLGKRWLGLIIFLSFLFHLAALFVLELAPIPGEGSHPKVRSVVYVSSGLESMTARESDPLTWIRWRDPTVIALPRAALPEPPAKDLASPNLRDGPLPELPEYNPLISTLSRDAYPLQETVDTLLNSPEVPAMPLVQEAPPKLSGSVIVLRGALKDRAVIKRFELPRPATRQNLQSTVYFLEVSTGGWVVQCRVERSCGDTSVDLEGVQALMQWRFEPINEPDNKSVWAPAEVFWDLRSSESERDEFSF